MSTVKAVGGVDLLLRGLYTLIFFLVVKLHATYILQNARVSFQKSLRTPSPIHGLGSGLLLKSSRGGEWIHR